MNEETPQAASDTTSNAAPRVLNEMTRTDAGPVQRTIPDHVAPHYRLEGNAFHSAYRPDKIDFIDRGNRMHAHQPVSTFTVRSMVEIAEARGWKGMDVSGSEPFRQSAYVEASSRGLEVKGYSPTEKDAAILQRREDRKAAVDNPLVQAFLEADSKKSRDDAIKAYPALKNAFAVEAASQAFATEKIDSKRGAQNFVERMRDSIAIALHTGRDLPDVQVSERAPRPESRREPERAR